MCVYVCICVYLCMCVCMYVYLCRYETVPMCLPDVCHQSGLPGSGRTNSWPVRPQVILTVLSFPDTLQDIS